MLRQQPPGPVMNADDPGSKRFARSCIRIDNLFTIASQPQRDSVLA
jgi:hypothetical protein